MPEQKLYFANTFNSESIIAVFVLEDPSLSVSKRYEAGNLTLDIEYEFNTDILFAFSYHITKRSDGTEERKYYAHYMNRVDNVSKEEIELDSDLVNLRLEEKRFIYNGSIYKMINN